MAAPDDPAERRVGQPERGQPGEGHHVRAEPDHHVEESRPRPARCRRPAAAPRPAARRTRARARPTREHRRATGREPSQATRYQPRSGQARGQEQGAPGDAGRARRAPAPAALADPVDRAERVRAGQQHGAQPDPGEQQRHRLLHRRQPQRRDHPGRTEALAVQQAEQHAGQRPPRRRTASAAAAGPAVAAGRRISSAAEQQQGAVTDVTEHRTEHHHVRQSGEHGRIDVRVGHGGVGAHEGGEIRPPGSGAVAVGG